MYNLAYCFTYGLLKLYVHYDNNVRLIYRCDFSGATILPNITGKRSLMAPTLVGLYF